MLYLALALFVAVLVVLAVAAARGLRHIDDILEVVDTDRPIPHAEG
ncbi:MAG: hypothetical protein AAF845_04510 [Bacteroidota bacterium]